LTLNIDRRISAVNSQRSAASVPPKCALAEGVAHEMNTPLSFISSNLNMLKEYVEKLTEYIFVLSREIKPESIHGIDEVKERLDIDFIVQDGGEVILESLEGTERIANIVQILTESSNKDQSDCCLTDINKCIDDAMSSLLLAKSFTEYF